MNKASLCKDIGEFFGNYFEEDGKICIDNGEEIFQYDTPDELLKGWVETLVWHQHDTFGDPSGNWEDAIVFIYTEVIGKSPVGVCLVDGPKGKRWKSYVDVATGNPHGKNLYLGTYSSIVDAIFARKDFLPLVKERRPLEELAARAKEISQAANEENKRRKAPKCPHCGVALI